jgi:tight adherence protein C
LTPAGVLAALSAIAGLSALATLARDLSARRMPLIRFRFRFSRPSRDWQRLKVACALAGGLLAVFVFSPASLRVLALLTTAAGVAGYVAPDLWLARRSRRRIDVALRDLPDMLDLLRVAVAAGASPIRALTIVAGEFPGPLADEWRRVSAAAELGMRQRDALHGLAERIPHDDVRAFVETLRRGQRHGTSLTGALAAQAARMRHSRAQQLRERGARAGPKIQLVVALVLVPSVLLLLIAGVVAELQRSGLVIPS